jgi:hypothetical protein
MRWRAVCDCGQRTEATRGAAVGAVETVRGTAVGATRGAAVMDARGRNPRGTDGRVGEPQGD